jgi:hypothetical protein
MVKQALDAPRASLVFSAQSEEKGNSMTSGSYARAGLALATTGAVAAAIALTGGGGYASAGLARSNAAAAQYQYPEERPGWGCGDKNHDHTGPPGRREYGPSGSQYPPTPPPGCTQYKGR